MTRWWYFDREGRPVDVVAWAALLGDPSYVMIDAAFIGPYFVSTRWVGIDQPLSDDDGEPRAPLVYETTAVEGRVILEVRRYPTEAAARAGHADVVKRLRRFRRRRTLSLVVIGLFTLTAGALYVRWWS